MAPESAAEEEERLRQHRKHETERALQVGMQSHASERVAAQTLARQLAPLWSRYGTTQAFPAVRESA